MTMATLLHRAFKFNAYIYAWNLGRRKATCIPKLNVYTIEIFIRDKQNSFEAKQA